MPDEHRQDPQDKEFGAQASRDADVADRIADEQGADAVPGEGRAAPRASGKAEPEDGQS